MYSMSLLYTVVPLAAMAACIYLWKSGKFHSWLDLLPLEEGSGLEFLKLPEKPLYEEVKGVELIQFKGKDGLELLVPPWLRDTKKKQKKTTVPNTVTLLLTGENLTGYFQMLTKILFVLEENPVFLVAKERDIERFKRHSNIMISIFKHTNQIIEELRMLEFQFHKGIISEEEFKKKALKLQLQSAKSLMKEKLYEGYRYFSRPAEILQDLKAFLAKTSGKGIVVITMADELMDKNPRKATAFLDHLLSLCSQHKSALVLTCEQGVFDERVTNTLKSYSDLVMETSLEKGKRYVTVYSFEKVFPKMRINEALKNYTGFLKKTSSLK